MCLYYNHEKNAIDFEPTSFVDLTRLQLVLSVCHHVCLFVGVGGGQTEIQEIFVVCTLSSDFHGTLMSSRILI